MRIVSRVNCLGEYTWGNQCTAWNLADNPGLSIKLETMPSGATEEKHFHRHAQQFFYILKGEACIEIESETIIVKANEGVQINAFEKHRIFNVQDSQLEFLIISQPSTAHDRFVVR